MDFKRSFDANECKHYLEDQYFVLHCHHYNTLTHRALTATPYIDGKAFIFRCVRDDFYENLSKVAQNKGLRSGADVLKMAQEFYAYTGLGQIDLGGLTASGGTVVSSHSHLATGYLNKWGPQSAPVDDFGRAFAAAVCAVAFGLNVQQCHAEQTHCIACGAKECIFRVTVS